VGSPLVLFEGLTNTFADVKMALNGDTLVVGSTSSGALGQLIHANGTLETSFTISALASGEPMLGLDEAGRASVIWPEGGSLQYRRFSVAGTPLTPVTTLSTESGFTKNRFALDTNPAGVAVAAWVESDSIRLVRFDGTTGSVVSSQTVTTFAPGTPVSVDTAISPDGSYVVMSTRHDTGAIHGFRYSSTDTLTSNTFYGSISPTLTGHEVLFTAIDLDPDANAIIVTTDPLGGAGSVRRKVYTNQGSLISSETLNGGSGGNFSAGGFSADVFATSGRRSYATATGFSLDINEYPKVWDQQGIRTDLPNSLVFFGVSRIAGNGLGSLALTRFGKLYRFADVAARTSGPYMIAEGQSLTLDASASTSPIVGELTYGWDLNNDGNFTDVTDANPTIDWATLQSFGLGDGPGVYLARLKVTDSSGSADVSDPINITVTNAPPVTTPLVELRTGVRGLVAVSVSTVDSVADLAANMLYDVDWDNDGTFDESVSAPGTQLGAIFTHTYTTFGSKTIRLRATDKDGGVSPVATTTFDVFPLVLYPSLSADDWSWLGTNGDDEVAISVVDNTTLRVIETKVNGVAGNNVYDVTTAPLDARSTYITADGLLGNNRIDLSSVIAPIAGTTISAGNGTDFLIGSAVADQIFGGYGNDTIHGGYGADNINAGPDDDLIFGEMPATPTLTPLLASMGADTIYGGGGNDTIYGDSDGGEGKPDLIYGDGGLNDSFGDNDTIYGDGTVGHQQAGDTIYGEGGNDFIHGDASGAEGSADSLFGGFGDDLIDTGGGNDYAEGNMGNDILLGGDGAEGANDTLNGGAGRDILVGDGGVADPKSKVSGADVLNATYDGDLSDNVDSIDLIITGLALPTIADPIDWFAIQAEWNRTDNDTFTKKQHLTGALAGGLNGSSLLLPGVNIFDDRLPGPPLPPAIVDQVISANADFDPSNASLIFSGTGDILSSPNAWGPEIVDLTPYPRPA
jgi:hypothetical protein